mgnify:CR=1 FL=1
MYEFVWITRDLNVKIQSRDYWIVLNENGPEHDVYSLGIVCASRPPYLLSSRSPQRDKTRQWRDINFPDTARRTAVRSEFVISNNRRQKGRGWDGTAASVRRRNLERVSRICKLFRPVSFNAAPLSESRLTFIVGSKFSNLG